MPVAQRVSIRTLRPIVQPNFRQRLQETRATQSGNRVSSAAAGRSTPMRRIAAALLRARGKRPCSRASKRGNEISPSHCLPQAPDQAFNSGHQTRNLLPAIWARLSILHCRNYETTMSARGHSRRSYRRQPSSACPLCPEAAARRSSVIRPPVEHRRQHQRHRRHDGLVERRAGQASGVVLVGKVGVKPLRTTRRRPAASCGRPAS